MKISFVWISASKSSFKGTNSNLSGCGSSGRESRQSKELKVGHSTDDDSTIEIFDEPVCLSQDLFNQWSGQPLPNVFFSLWKETLPKFWMNILYNNFFTFLFYIDCFPFYPWCEGVGNCNREWWYWREVESSAEGRRRREWRGKNSCLSLSPFSPPQLLCTRLPRALFIIWIVPNILDVDHLR